MAQRDRPQVSGAEADPVIDEVPTVLAEPAMSETPAAEPLPPKPDARMEMRGSEPRSVFLPAVGGGFLAAAIGFGLSHFNVFGLTATPVDLSSLQARMTAIEESQAKTVADLAQLRSTPAGPDPALADRVAALENAEREPVSDPAMADLVRRMDALETQLSEAASAGTGASGAALAALQAEVRAIKAAAPVATEDLSTLIAETKASLAEAEAKAETLTANAEAIAKAATLTAAVGQLRVALETGQPYAATLALLQGETIPAALSDFVDSGVPSLGDLKVAFPDAARAALDAARRADPGQSWADRVGTFLQSQTGVRSVTPREGSDPDAILSRAEAAVASGNLDDALQEISALPEVSRAAMADWTEAAKRHTAAAAAIEALAANSGG